MREMLVVIKELVGMMLLITEGEVGVLYKVVLSDIVEEIIMEVMADLVAAAAVVMVLQVIISILEEEEEAILAEELPLQIIMLVEVEGPTVHQHLTHPILQVRGKAMVK